MYFLFVVYYAQSLVFTQHSGNALDTLTCIQLIAFAVCCTHLQKILFIQLRIQLIAFAVCCTHQVLSVLPFDCIQLIAFAVCCTHKLLISILKARIQLIAFAVCCTHTFAKIFNFKDIAKKSLCESDKTQQTVNVKSLNFFKKETTIDTFGVCFLPLWI